MIELEMLIEVDRICKKYGIKYNIIGGTLLGAVRHGGFIPWDDDADLAMLRPEYEKFREACKKELDHDRFYFQDYRNTPGYRWGYGKLRRKGTVFLREYQEHMPYEQGVFIDIFPLDGVPDSFILRRLKDIECFCIRKILWSAVGKYADKSMFCRRWYSLLSNIPETMIFSYLNRLIVRSNKNNTQRVRILLMPSPNKEYCYYRKWFETGADMNFEGYPLQGIVDYDGFLTFEFGDYRQLPPIEKRKVHPVSAIQLIEV
ncbi:phosphorylcholine transferase LicD [Sporomusa sp. GT1]|uniref:LicD family protein n=1 Tax=Sporomusa sp. GT1 TaxID=1534747 RepID=UPI001CB8563F|nr:LicD family protein [Sporomusa sp. GT1]